MVEAGGGPNHIPRTKYTGTQGMFCVLGENTDQARSVDASLKSLQRAHNTHEQDRETQGRTLYHTFNLTHTLSTTHSHTHTHSLSHSHTLCLSSSSPSPAPGCCLVHVAGLWGVLLLVAHPCRLIARTRLLLAKIKGKKRSTTTCFRESRASAQALCLRC